MTTIYRQPRPTFGDLTRPADVSQGAARRLSRSALLQEEASMLTPRQHQALELIIIRLDQLREGLAAPIEALAVAQGILLRVLVETLSPETSDEVG
jgi:hypothetical protein